MAKITLDKLAHSYYPKPKSDADFALKELDYEWEDGGAYALLGPSGCGQCTFIALNLKFRLHPHCLQQGAVPGAIHPLSV